MPLERRPVGGRGRFPVSVESMPTPDHPVEPTGRPTGGGPRAVRPGQPLLGPEGSVHVGDQQARGAGLGLGGGEPLVQPRDDVGEVLALVEVSGRGEERFPMDQPVRRSVDHALVRESGPVLTRGESVDWTSQNTFRNPSSES